MIANDQRSHSCPVAELHIGEFYVPLDLTALRIEAKQVRIGRFKIEPVSIHADAALPDMQALIRAVMIMPVLPSGTRIHRPDIVRLGEIEGAIDQQRG